MLTWERTVKQARGVPSSAIGSILENMPGSVLGSVQSSRLGVCHQVQLKVSLKACPEVYLGTS